MLDDIIRNVVRAQFGDVRRRTRGAVLEAAALGMTGLATFLIFAGLFIWLSDRIEAWLAAMLLAGVALFIAVVLMLMGRSLMRRKEPDPHDQAVSVLEALGLLSRNDGSNKTGDYGQPNGGPALVAAALAAGLMLGRSTKR